MPTGSAAAWRPWPRAPPTLAREQFLVALVGELRVRDRELALQLLVARRSRRAACRPRCPRARRRSSRPTRRRRVAAALDQPLEPAEVGLDRPLRALQREDQRHVDVAAAGGHLLDRRQPRLRRRDLHEQFGRSIQLVQALRFGDVAVGVVGEVRVDLDRDVAVLALAARPRPGAAGRRRRAMSCDGEPRGRPPSGRLPRLEHLAQLLVVGVALRDRLLEDRRVRGDADDGVLLASSARARPLCSNCGERKSIQTLWPSSLSS